MIVISTNNGMKWIDQILQSLVEFGPPEPILIVDTRSEPAYYAYLQTLVDKYPLDLTVTQTPYAGRDIGAIVWAFRNFPADDYIFLHDSMIVKESNWLEVFRAQMPDDKLGVVAWQLFNYPSYNCRATSDWVQEKLGCNDFKGFGIIGPTFYTTYKTYQILEAKNQLNAIPTNKDQQVAMELGWAAICHNAEIPLIGLYQHKLDLDWQKHLNGEYPLFKKFLGGRI
jgi:hypothetical protein